MRNFTRTVPRRGGGGLDPPALAIVPVVAAPEPVVLAVDAGTTGVRTQAFDRRGTEVDRSYRELTQHFPRPGWVEHDADEIWTLVAETLAEVVGRLDGAGRTPAALGITNQRETVVAWDRRTGRPRYRALVWQDRRTAGRCDELVRRGYLPLVRARTGLVLDPYFSATKMHWLLTEGGVEDGPDLALGTVDSWLLWHLTGGTDGGRFATDVSNASRTSLLDVSTRRWSDELCDVFGVPAGALPEVRPSCGRFGTVHPSVAGGGPLAGVAVGGMAGDQHAALFGQACFDPGMVKVTYGTGSFVLMHAGPTCPAPADGLLTTLAWELDADIAGASGVSPVSYALEGSVFASGAAVQWLRDGIGVIDRSEDLEPLARTVGSSEGVVVVPAFTGLGSPHWDPYARGTVVGLSRGSTRAHLARAVVEAMSFQVADVVAAMEAAVGVRPPVLRVDGGASVMDLLLQLQADQTRVRVARPRSIETTGFGAAALAGLAVGVWGTLGDLRALWTEDASFDPSVPDADAVVARQAWTRALGRSREWVEPG